MQVRQHTWLFVNRTVKKIANHNVKECSPNKDSGGSVHFFNWAVSHKANALLVFRQYKVQTFVLVVLQLILDLLKLLERCKSSFRLEVPPRTLKKKLLDYAFVLIVVLNVFYQSKNNDV